VVSFALWPNTSSDFQTSYPWLIDALDKPPDFLSDSPCFASFALVGIHTHKTGHLYDRCSNNHTYIVDYHPRKHISEVSTYIKGKNAHFYPVLTLLDENSQVNCSFFRWSIGVGYVICPLEPTTCSMLESRQVNLNIHSLRATKTCHNPISINFTTQSVALRRKMLPPVNLSICIYSGFRPNKNTRFYNVLEANIEYHRHLGVQRFYILDRNFSHHELFEKHRMDWLETGLVHFIPYTIGETLNMDTMQSGGFRDQGEKNRNPTVCVFILTCRLHTCLALLVLLSLSLPH
jgi:hypothetical protein